MNQQVGFIFPKSGYKNEQFVLRFTQPSQEYLIEILRLGEVIKTFSVNAQSHVILDQLTMPGKYEIIFRTGQEFTKQVFEVKDAIRLGTSTIKQVYPLLKSDILVIVMKDRMLFYDEKEHYFFEENGLSPSELHELADGRLLLMTHIGKANEITNYAIYSLSDHSIARQLLNDYAHLGYNAEKGMLLVENKKNKRISAINLAMTGRQGIAMRLEKEYTHFEFTEGNDAIIIRHENECFYYNLISGEAASVELTQDICLDLKGKTIYTISGNQLSYAKLFEPQIKWHQDLPGDFILAEENYYHVGAQFPRNPSNQTLRDLKEKVLETYAPDQTWTGYYQSLDLPDEITGQKFIKKDYSLFRSGHTLVVAENEYETNITRLMFNKKRQEGWVGEIDIKTVAQHTLRTFYFKDVEVIKQGSFPFAQVTNSKNWLVISHVSDLLIFKDNRKAGTARSLNFRDIQIRAFGDNYYLILKSVDKYSIYRLTEDVKWIVSDVSVANWQHVESYGKVFYKIIKNTRSQETYLECYDLAKAQNLKLKDDNFWQQRWSWGQRISFQPGYILIDDDKLVAIESLKINDPIIGKVQATSKNLRKVVSLRGKDLLLAYQNQSETNYQYTEILLPAIKYSEAYLAPDGNHLVLQKDYNKYSLYDVETGEEEHYFSGKFLTFNPDGNMVVENDVTRKAMVYDPATFKEITPANYQHYQFSSPDGSLYADLTKSVKYYHRLRNCYISYEDFRKLNQEFGSQLSNYQTAQKATHTRNREQYYIQHQTALNKLGINSASSICTEILVRTESYIHIGVTNTDVKTEVNFPGDLKYYNYAAFSADNQYFGYVGKPHVKGHITIYKISYDRENKRLSLTKDYNSHYPYHASWVCAFSKNNLFATYDSNPHTYLISADQLFQNQITDEELHAEGFQKSRNSIFSNFKAWRMIHDKSFVCFSPSGKYIALSEQGYDPLTLGGYGHADSCALHVADSDSGQILFSFLDHGETLAGFKQTKLVFAAFSADEKKLMSLSADGVILVRKLEVKSPFKFTGMLKADTALEHFGAALRGQ